MMNYHFSLEELKLLYMIAKLAISSPAILETFKNIVFKDPRIAPVDDETLKKFLNVFLGKEEKITLVPAQYSHKPNFKPDDYDPRQHHTSSIFTIPTLNAAHSYIRMVEAFEGRIKEVDELMAVRGEGNLVVFGSPTSSLISRVALGYEEINNGLDGSRYIPKDAFDLKIRYALAKDEILSVDSVHQYVDRDDPNNKPKVLNWGAVKSNGQIILPETKNGSLLQDYLIISCLPNTFNKHSYERGHRLLNIGGTHREGTMAAEKLFSNKNMLTVLNENLKVDDKADIQYWQALILVDFNPASKTASLNNIMEFSPIEIHEPAIETMVQANHKALMSYGDAL